MKVSELINRAIAKGFLVKREGDNLRIHKLDGRNGQISVGVWINVDGEKFMSAFRTDIDLTLTTTIRSVKQCAKILGV